MVLGTNAMVRFELETGSNFLEAAQGLQSEGAPSVLLLRNLFMVGVRPDITGAEAGDLIDEIGFAEAANLIGSAMEKAFDGLIEADPENPPKASTKA